MVLMLSILSHSRPRDPLKIYESTLRYEKGTLSKIRTMKDLFRNHEKGGKSLGRNRGYWTRYFTSLGLGDNQWKNVTNGQNGLYPFYVFRPANCRRMVRIELLSIEPSDFEDEDDDFRFITSWLDSHCFEDEVRELVIVLLQTEVTVQLAKRLIKDWFKQNDSSINELISEIYSHHDSD